MSQIIEMQPSESRVIPMNFTPNLGAGETITSITSVVALPAGVTITEKAIDPTGKKIQFRVTGTAGNYNIAAIVVTSASNTLEGDGRLNIRSIA